MNMHTKSTKKYLAVFFILLILMYASGSLLPHPHACMDVSCVFCTIIEHTHDLPAGALLIAGSGLLTCVIFTILIRHTHMLPVFGDTPVGLKVKLSN